MNEQSSSRRESMDSKGPIRPTGPIAPAFSNHFKAIQSNSNQSKNSVSIQPFAPQLDLLRLRRGSVTPLVTGKNAKITNVYKGCNDVTGQTPWTDGGPATLTLTFTSPNGATRRDY